MESSSKNKNQLAKEAKSVPLKKEKKESSRSEEWNQQEDDRNGIIPEGMNFKKFIGCGG